MNLDIEVLSPAHGAAAQSDGALCADALRQWQLRRTVQQDERDFVKDLGRLVLHGR
jgi:hypothetical protein